MFIFAFRISIFAFSMRSLIAFKGYLKEKRTSRSGILEMLPSW